MRNGRILQQGRRATTRPTGSSAMRAASARAARTVSAAAVAVPMTLALVALPTSPAHAAAQMDPTAAAARVFAEERAKAVEGVGRKLSSLAEAIPAELRDWRPGEGVRSFREVFALVATEWAYFPDAWGSSSGSTRSLQEVRQELETAAWDDLIGALRSGSARYAETIRRAEGDGGAHDIGFFDGRQIPARDALALLQYDMHEHLGQAIAYARMNDIVPPWSRD